MPKLAYPCDFDGLTGVYCTADIEHREAFLYVPYKMTISAGKAESHPILKKVMDENPKLFTEQDDRDYESLTLVLFMIYEITLLKHSYWYPYLR